MWRNILGHFEWRAETLLTKNEKALKEHWLILEETRLILEETLHLCADMNSGWSHIITESHISTQLPAGYDFNMTLTTSRHRVFVWEICPNVFTVTSLMIKNRVEWSLFYAEPLWADVEWAYLQACPCSMDVFFNMSRYFLSRDRCYNTFIFPSYVNHLLCRSPGCFPALSLQPNLVSAIRHNQWGGSHYEGKRATLKCCIWFYCTYSLPYRVFKAYMLSISCHCVWSPEAFKCRSVDRHQGS